MTFLSLTGLNAQSPESNIRKFEIKVSEEWQTLDSCVIYPASVQVTDNQGDSLIQNGQNVIESIR